MMVPSRSGFDYPVRNTLRARPARHRNDPTNPGRHFCHCIILALMTAAGAPSFCAAQNTDAIKQPAWRRFTLIASAGPVMGGPATGLVEQLEEAGFDDVSPFGASLSGYYWVPRAHPFENDDRASLALTARYALTRDWALGAGFASTDLGGASGYQADPADPDALGERIESVWSGKQFWLAAFWTPTDWFRIGGGPGAYFLTNDDAVGHEIDETRFGATLETGAVSPNLGWFVVDFGVRLHLIPATDVETATYSGVSSVTLRPEWTHVEFAFGIGLRP